MQLSFQAVVAFSFNVSGAGGKCFLCELCISNSTLDGSALITDMSTVLSTFIFFFFFWLAAKSDDADK